MPAKMGRRFAAWLILVSLCFCASMARAQTGAAPQHEGREAASVAAPGSHEAGSDAGESSHNGPEEQVSTFYPHAGTWFNGVTRKIFGQGEVRKHGEHWTNIGQDFIVIAVLIMVGLALLGFVAARGLKVRPEGKPHSLANATEAAVEGFQNYLVGVMGERMARKYMPLIATFFFTILLMNWMGLVPGLLAPTSNPNVPIGLAIVAFFAVHIIAIREAGFKSWFMHFVGEPKWLAPLNFPLHIMGELIKPLSLSLRLLCNVFGEEMVVTQIALMAIGIAAALHLPAIIPLQLPFMLLGVFFGALQALVFSTLLAIYISILSTHHDDHDSHNAHGDVEHDRINGREQIVAHPTEATLA